jgi:hypothetical protein
MSHHHHHQLVPLLFSWMTTEPGTNLVVVQITMARMVRALLAAAD